MGWGRGQQHRLWRAEFKDVSTPELRSKAMADGLNGYFPKPLDIPEFVKSIKVLFPLS